MKLTLNYHESQGLAFNQIDRHLEAQFNANPNQMQAKADELLVLRCLRNEKAAWDALFNICQPQIVTKLCRLFGSGPGALESAQDVAAQVWLAVLADRGRLLSKYDADMGARVTTYLNSIAYKLGLGHLRETRRRLRREGVYAAEQLKRIEVLPSTAVELQEFEGELSPREAAFYREALTGATEASSTENLSEQNTWQLRHRIRRKLILFLEKRA